MNQILKLDQGGQPNSWVGIEAAITYHAKGLVVYQIGDLQHSTFRGGNCRSTGLLSTISTAPIIAVRGEHSHRKQMNRTPVLNNRELFSRDRYTCAYCGRVFNDSKLTRDHIIPLSRGGLDVWTNCVTACEHDNHLKNDKLLEEIGMELLYVPYTPNRAEHLILRGRKILPIQAEYLAQFIPRGSRTHQVLADAQVH